MFVSLAVAYMAAALEADHKHIKPVLVNDKIKYDVHRKILGTRKAVYCNRLASIASCCKALRKRFPAEATRFTPRKLLLEKTGSAQIAKSAAFKKQHDTIRRIEKVKYVGVSRAVHPNGKVVW